MKHLHVFESHHPKEEFSWDELSPEAKKKAIDFHRDWLTDGWDWSESIIEDETEKMEALGVTVDKISFSGFNSQGDGASFTGRVKPEEMPRFLKECLGLEIPPEVCEHLVIVMMRRSTRYLHSRSVNFVCENSSGENVVELFPFGFEFPRVWHLDEVMDEIELAGEKWLVKTGDAIYKKLEAQYEFLSSDAEVESALADSGLEWTEDGKAI